VDRRQTGVLSDALWSAAGAVVDLRHAHIFFWAKAVKIGFIYARAGDSRELMVQGLIDLGSFGDERLQKRGPIFWRRSSPSARPVCGGLAAIGQGMWPMDGFCTMGR
jgi:hypothetical protein